MNQSLFQIQGPRDLLFKLQHDYSRLQQTPNDPYVAFDFFVTAEHLLDWIYPGSSGKPGRAAERDANLILQVVSHLATGAKHFIPQARHHVSVQHAVVAPTNYGEAQSGTAAYGAPHLVVDL